MRRLIQGCRKFLHSNGLERGIALEAMLALAATWVGLRTMGFERWKTIMARLSQNKVGATSAPTRPECVALIARMELAVARHLPFRTNCLEQSLVLLWLLGRRGIAAELRIGARKESDRFEAHAWVEFEGAPINDAGDEHHHFVPFEKPVSSMEAQTH
ncbi:MAG: lasso peptide biosynthesis B2 protein [Candidatus Acidiferrales bacterium]